MRVPLLQFLCDTMAQALFDPDDTKLKRYGTFYPKKVIHKVIKLKQNRPHVGLSSPSKVLKTTSKTTLSTSKPFFPPFKARPQFVIMSTFTLKPIKPTKLKV